MVKLYDWGFISEISKKPFSSEIAPFSVPSIITLAPKSGS